MSQLTNVKKSDKVVNPLASIFDFWPTKWQSYFDFKFDPVPISVGGDENNITVEFEVPGFSKSDINVSVLGKTLKVECKNDKKKAFFQSTIPYTAQVDNPEVKLENGVLSVSFQRSPEARPKILTIK